jgi:hypothetical protein
MLEKAPLEEVRAKVSKAYKYDDGKFTGVTKKERARREVAEKIKKLKEISEQ